MKVLAMYLPQFHKVKENDEWWGEGFTEWTTVKNAKCLYDEHKQPRIPQKNNYYDLMKKETMQWQADLMKKYGIDGMCIYHYWFQNGKQILEKPIENLLQWKDIDMPFCLYWANETWARTWSAIENANSWAGTYETKNKVGKSVLLLQDYGDEKQWREHFQYLLQFFKDKRYIKIEGKPVFLFYKTSQIPCFENMVDEWQKLAKKAGFPGIYIIANECKKSSKLFYDAEIFHEPARSLMMYGGRELKTGLRSENFILDYDCVWNQILNNTAAEPGVLVSGFVGYDDTPRHGNRGTVIEGSTPQKFERYLTELLAKNYVLENEIVLINAWNEWGEGMYLEPDEENGEAYLHAIDYAKKNYKEYVSKYQRLHAQHFTGEKIKKEYDKYKHYSNILDKWLCLKEQNIDIEQVLFDKGYRKIALYGYGMLGKHFLQDVSEKYVKVEYIIDKNKNGIVVEKQVLLPHDNLPEVDLVVVSPTYSYGSIYKYLKDKNIKEIVSLEQIIEESMLLVIGEK